MTEYHFNAKLAQRHGVNGAIFLHAMAFWVAKNQANGRHFHEGRTWTYNTLDALTKLFPFWTRRQVERIVAKLKDEGALLTGNFSQDKTDRTVWYALADQVLEVYGLLARPFHRMGKWVLLTVVTPRRPFHQMVKCISPNRDNHFTRRGNVIRKQLLTSYIIPPYPPRGSGGP